MKINVECEMKIVNAVVKVFTFTSLIVVPYAFRLCNQETAVICVHKRVFSQTAGVT